LDTLLRALDYRRTCQRSSVDERFILSGVYVRLRDPAQLSGNVTLGHAFGPEASSPVRLLKWARTLTAIAGARNDDPVKAEPLLESDSGRIGQ
jgi:hypothetical protein